jgi:phosphoribosyl-ATP pyrophosphohydrolase/phosphoribosyl-AMP cyclohydrolase
LSKIRLLLSEQEIEQYFHKSVLVPAVVQEAKTGDVLMLAYMNQESLKKTIETGSTWFYSRSRKELWNKGATSGHWQRVLSIRGDCDQDTLLIQVEQIGSACHTGAHSCFFNEIGIADTDQGQYKLHTNTLAQLYEVISQRQSFHQEGSYTSYLFEKGLDKILKKCGEECAEVLIAAKNQDKLELTNELCDLIFHLLVLMKEQNISLDDVLQELDNRGRKIGNLKEFHKVDKNS